MGLFQFKGTKGTGTRSIAEAGKVDMEYLSFALMDLEAGQSQDWKTNGTEAGLVLLEGEVEMSGAGLSVKGSRSNVFKERPTILYLPPNSAATVKALSKARVAVCSTKASGAKKAFVVRPEDVKPMRRGTGSFGREVCEIIHKEYDTNNLILGETFNDAGGWSSYPPHKHENDRPPVESDMEEIYHFRMDPPQGFGFMRIYTEDRKVDETMTIEDGDTVIIKEGYHPLTVGGGYRLYYLWFLGGAKKELIAYDDPAHSWTKKI